MSDRSDVSGRIKTLSISSNKGQGGAGRPPLQVDVHRQTDSGSHVDGISEMEADNNNKESDEDQDDKPDIMPSDGDVSISPNTVISTANSSSGSLYSATGSSYIERIASVTKNANSRAIGGGDGAAGESLGNTIATTSTEAGMKPRFHQSWAASSMSADVQDRMINFQKSRQRSSGSRSNSESSSTVCSPVTSPKLSDKATSMSAAQAVAEAVRLRESSQERTSNKQNNSNGKSSQDTNGPNGDTVTPTSNKSLSVVNSGASTASSSPDVGTPNESSKHKEAVAVDARTAKGNNLERGGDEATNPGNSASTATAVNEISTGAISADTVGSLGTSPTPSGALFANAQSVSLSSASPRPSLSQRRGMVLNTGGKGTSLTSTGSSGAGAGLGSMQNRRNKPGLTLAGLRAGGGPKSGPGNLAPGGISIPTSSGASRPFIGGMGPITEGAIMSEPSSNLFSSYGRYIDIKTGSLNFAGKASVHAHGIEFSSGSSFRISLDELELMGELGRGNYGTVTKVLHKPTNVIMAMKEIRLELEETKFRQIIMELEILHKCVSPYIVDFYGAFFVEGAVYVCMEYMDGGSLNKIYDGGIGEPYLAKIADAVVRGLKQLKEEHNIIHRDVKPTNILVSTSGKVKLCDFGVSGNLVASIARTNVGCQSYMAPERIRSRNPNEAITYTVESDVWSLGLSLVEIASGQYPYPAETYGNIFSQLSAIVDGAPPTLPDEGAFSEEAQSFVAACLHKLPKQRPTYGQLLEHPWLKKYRDEEVDMGGFVKQALERSNEL